MSISRAIPAHTHGGKWSREHVPDRWKQIANGLVWGVQPGLLADIYGADGVLADPANENLNTDTPWGYGYELDGTISGNESATWDSPEAFDQLQRVTRDYAWVWAMRGSAINSWECFLSVDRANDTAGYLGPFVRRNSGGNVLDFFCGYNGSDQGGFASATGFILADGEWHVYAAIRHDQTAYFMRDGELYSTDSSIANDNSALIGGEKAMVIGNYRTGDDTGTQYAIGPTMFLGGYLPLMDAADLCHDPTGLLRQISNIKGIAPAVAGPILKTGSESNLIGISDTSLINSLLSISESFPINTQESSLSNLKSSRSDSIRIDMQESSLFLIQATAQDSVKVQIVDDSLIFATISNLSDSLKIGIIEAAELFNAVFVGSSDSISIALVEDKIINSVLARSDSPVMGLSEALDIFNQYSVVDSTKIQLSDSSSIFVTLTTVDDSVVIQLTDIAQTVNVIIAGSDSVSVGINEFNLLLNSISSSESLEVALTDNINSLISILSRSDSTAIILTDSETLLDITSGLIEKTGSELLSIQLVSVSDLSITELGLLPHLIANAKLLISKYDTKR